VSWRREAIVLVWQPPTSPDNVILRSIERHVQEVRVAVHEITGAAGLKLDVGERIRGAPLTWAVAAALVGLWLGSRGTPADVARKGRS
jgi:hypothetical protein